MRKSIALKRKAFRLGMLGLHIVSGMAPGWRRNEAVSPFESMGYIYLMFHDLFHALPCRGSGKSFVAKGTEQHGLG